MPAFLVLLVNVGVAVVLLVAGGSGRVEQLLGRRLPMLAALPLLSAGLLGVYVFGEDSYRDSGISRWSAYQSPGGALGPMFVLSIVLMAACAVLLIFFSLHSRGRPFRVTALAGGFVALFLLTPTIIGFTAN